MSSHHQQIQNFADLLEEWDYKIDRLEHRVRDFPQELSNTIHDKYDRLKAFRSDLLKKESDLEDRAQRGIHSLDDKIKETLNSMDILFQDIELDVNVEVS